MVRNPTNHFTGLGDSAERDNYVPTSRDLVKLVIEEARMILPGVQALFGFQLIVVFHETFAAKLSSVVQDIHLCAIVLTVLSIGLLMAPAAFDRQNGRRSFSFRFVKLSTRLITGGMVALMCSMCLDLYIVTLATTGSLTVSLAIGLLVTAMLSTLWFWLPHADRKF